MALVSLRDEPRIDIERGNKQEAVPCRTGSLDGDVWCGCKPNVAYLGVGKPGWPLLADESRLNTSSHKRRLPARTAMRRYHASERSTQQYRPLPQQRHVGARKCRASIVNIRERQRGEHCPVADFELLVDMVKMNFVVPSQMFSRRAISLFGRSSDTRCMI